MRMLIRLLELIKWLPVRSYDPMHKHRRPLGHFMHYRLVELGADIVIGLQDQLHQILTQKLTDRELAEQVMSLRYRALAFSLRDRWGRCPFDGNNPTQLANLIALPPRLVDDAYRLIRTGNRLEFLFPPANADTDDTPTTSQVEEDDETPRVLDDPSAASQD